MLNLTTAASNVKFNPTSEILAMGSELKEYANDLRVWVRATDVPEDGVLGHVVVPPAAEPQRVARVWGEAVQRAAMAARHHPVAGAVYHHHRAADARDALTVQEEVYRPEQARERAWLE